MTAVALIELPSFRWNPSHGWNRLVARLRDDRGIGLVELLIALLVLNIGIFATLAAFTGGALAIRRASHISTATAIADQEVEVLRNTPYASLTSQPATLWPAAKTPDGRQYTVQVELLATSGSQLTTGTYQGSTQVKVLRITVRDVADSNKVLYTTSSTYSRCDQAGLGSDSTPCQS